MNNEDRRNIIINYANILLNIVEISGEYPPSEITYLRESINEYNETGVAWEGMRRFFESGQFDNETLKMVQFLNSIFID